MTKIEVFQALLDGKTIEKLFPDNQNSYYKIITEKLMVQSYRNTSFGATSVDTLFSFNYKHRILGKKSIVINGKTIELSEESYNELKRSLT